MADTRAETQDLIGRKVVDPHGGKVGTIKALIKHGDEERANWAQVKLGALGMSLALVPLHEAQELDGDVRIVYECEWVKSAPEVEPDGDHLGDEQADALCRHYGMDRITAPAVDDGDEIELSRETREAKPPAMDQGAFPKPPIPGIPEDQQPSPVKEESNDDSDEGDGR